MHVLANPLDFSQGMPPTLLVKDTDSLGEQIHRAFPDTRVVRTLNTMTADLQADPGQLAEGDHTVFLSGDDAEAKQEVTPLLASLGHTDAIDLSDITTARGTEMYLPVWLRLRGSLGTGIFNVKVVRCASEVDPSASQVLGTPSAHDGVCSVGRQGTPQGRDALLAIPWRPCGILDGL